MGQSVWRCSVETASERAARVSPCRIGLSSGDIGAVFGSALHHLQKARANILIFVRVRFETFLPVIITTKLSNVIIVTSRCCTSRER